MMRKTMEKMRYYDIKQWKKQESKGKFEQNANLIREEKRWKEQGEGKMMPSKIEAPMWDHYRVMEKQWKNGRFD